MRVGGGNSGGDETWKRKTNSSICTWHNYLRKPINWEDGSEGKTCLSSHPTHLCENLDVATNACIFSTGRRSWPLCAHINEDAHTGTHTTNNHKMEWLTRRGTNGKMTMSGLAADSHDNMTKMPHPMVGMVRAAHWKSLWKDAKSDFSTLTSRQKSKWCLNGFPCEI